MDEKEYLEMLEKRYQKTVEELLDGIDAGDFADLKKIPSKYKYKHLSALLYYTNVISNGKQYYQKIYDLIMAHGKYHISEKIRNHETIKIAFLSISAAEWPAERLYRLMEKNDKIETYVIVCPLADRDPADSRLTYQKTYDFFVREGYAVKSAYDFEKNETITWEQNGGIPDIVVHVTPWYESLLGEYQIENLPLTCLNCYVPYGMDISDNPKNHYIINYGYNKQFMNMVWRIYADSEINLRGYQTYGTVQGRNVRYSGYCKMDHFFQTHDYTEQDIRKLWKIPSHTEIHQMKRLIIAPHHSVMDDLILSYSTFHKNLYFLLYLAKKYENEITFIFKPHPNLRFRSVQAGVFKNLDEYDAYMELWNALPNARTVDEDDYLKIFETSDGMIMDSASFIAEYMYVNKPLLYLEKCTSSTFSELGMKIMECHYKADGTDYFGIGQFVQKVILQGEDVMKGKREKVLENELNYKKKNGCLASEFIYKDIISEIGL